MRIKKEFAVREVAGEFMLIPIGTAALDLNGIITTNEVGAIIWNLLDSVETEDELIACILNEYDVNEAVARNDVNDFLQKLRSLDIVE